MKSKADPLLPMFAELFQVLRENEYNSACVTLYLKKKKKKRRSENLG